MRIAICDDTPRHREELERLVGDYFSAQGTGALCSLYGSAEELLNAPEPLAFDLVFLDIYMAGMDGLACAQKLREGGFRRPIVFTTTSAEHGVDSYQVHASGYIVKPVTAQALKKTLDWLAPVLGQAARVIQVKEGRVTVPLDIQEIRYVEVERNTCLFHTAKGRYSAYRSLASVKEELGGEPFLQCSRRIMINMDQVLRPADGGFVMAGGDEVAVSQEERTRVKQAFFDYLWRKTRG